MSLDAYLVTASHRTQDLGSEWADAVRARLPAPLAQRLGARDQPPDIRLLAHLIRQCPDQQSVEGFLNWLATLSPGALYELLAPHAGDSLPANLGPLCAEARELLADWHDAYFRQVDPTILTTLAAEAERWRRMAIGMPADQLIDEITGSLWLEPTPETVTIYLIPQFHKRPVYLYENGPGQIILYLPVRDLPTPAGLPPTSLLRLTRTLADESRLRILYLLAGGPLSFADVVRQSGLTKGTVSRHLWMLRFARLVRGHYANGAVARYSLRPGALAQVSDALQRFVAPPERPRR